MTIAHARIVMKMFDDSKLRIEDIELSEGLFFCYDTHALSRMATLHR